MRINGQTEVSSWSYRQKKRHFHLRETEHAQHNITTAKCRQILTVKNNNNNNNNNNMKKTGDLANVGVVKGSINFIEYKERRRLIAVTQASTTHHYTRRYLTAVLPEEPQFTSFSLSTTSPSTSTPSHHVLLRQEKEWLRRKKSGREITFLEVEIN